MIEWPRPSVKQIIDLQRAQLAGLIERRGVNQMRRLYERSRADLESQLSALKRGGRDQTFSAHHLRLTLLQVRDALRAFGVTMSAHLDREGRTVGILSQRQLLTAVKKMEKRFTGVTPVLQTEQAAVLRGVFRRVDPSLLDRHKKSIALYTRPVVEKIKLELAQSILQNDAVDAAVDKVVSTDGIFDGERWRAERIVRTEMSYAAGIVRQRTMEELRDRDLPDLMKKLVATFDDRTGEDSEELNGQTVAIDQPFIWNKRTKGGVERVEYMQPPNRPHDREVVIPWRPEWKDSPTLDHPGPVDPVVPYVPPMP